MVDCRELCSPGDHRPDFDPVRVAQEFVFSDQLIASDDEMRFHHEIQFPQDLFAAFGPLDFDLTRGMAQLDDHGPMIRPGNGGLQISRYGTRGWRNRSAGGAQEGMERTPAEQTSSAP